MNNEEINNGIIVYPGTIYYYSVIKMIINKEYIYNNSKMESKSLRNEWNGSCNYIKWIL